MLRLANARGEMAAADEPGFFDHVLVNAQLEDTCARASAGGACGGRAWAPPARARLSWRFWRLTHARAPPAAPPSALLRRAATRRSSARSRATARCTSRARSPRAAWAGSRPSSRWLCRCMSGCSRATRSRAPPCRSGCVAARQHTPRAHAAQPCARLARRRLTLPPPAPAHRARRSSLRPAQASYISDASLIRRFSGLHSLDLSHNKLASLAPLSGLRYLLSLDASFNLLDTAGAAFEPPINLQARGAARSQRPLRPPTVPDAPPTRFPPAIPPLCPPTGAQPLAQPDRLRLRRLRARAPALPRPLAQRARMHGRPRAAARAR